MEIMYNNEQNDELLTSAHHHAKPMLGEVSFPHKAYQIDLNRLNEGYMSDTIMCYANSINEAKSILVKKVEWDGWTLNSNGEDVSYINIPVIRMKSGDKIFFEGNFVTEIEKNRIIFKRERLSNLNALLNDDDIKFCYIKKGSYYRPGSCGYTDMICKAGVYPKAEAVQHAQSCDEIILISIDIEAHNKIIANEISELSSRLL